MRIWLLRHLQALLATLGRMARAPAGSLLTILVMALALALPLCLLSIVDSARSGTGDLAGAISLSVYLKTSVSEERAQQLARQARARNGVARVELITASAALQKFRDQAGFAAVIDALEGNPLPHTLAVTPLPVASDPASVASLRAYFEAWPDAELVQLDAEWVNRFNALLGLMRAVLIVVSCLLCAAVVAVVSNTIRLEIQNRREEIAVIRLVGGSNGFVRRPLLYMGAVYGLLAALLAWLIVAVALVALRESAAALAQAYGSHFTLQGPSVRQLQWLTGAGLTLGWLGAWLAASHYLARLEPRG